MAANRAQPHDGRTVRALVLSGGGLFGAWQAGAWSALAGRFHPDLIVGASAGSLNGYLIACGESPEMLHRLWLTREMADFRQLGRNLRELTAHCRPKIDFAVVATDVVRRKPRIFRGPEITWRHLAASCALPFLLPQIRIGGRLYTDGGLLNPLPVYAAVELGASQIVALHALPVVPSAFLKPFALGFRALFGHSPAVHSGVRLAILKPGRRLGSMRDTAVWKRENIERWLRQGYEDATREPAF